MPALFRLALIPFVLSALLCVSCFVSAAYAEGARESLDASLRSILDILKNPDYANVEKRKVLRNDISKIVRKKFDFYEFSSRTVGQRWQSFTEPQRNAFAGAFADLLIQTYVNKIDGYNGEQIAFTGEKSSSKGDRVEIATVVTLKNGKKIPISYRMLPKEGTWKVYDVLIENISLVKNYRTQFQDLLKTQSAEEVVARIRSKTAEIEMNANRDKEKK